MFVERALTYGPFSGYFEYYGENRTVFLRLLTDLDILLFSGDFRFLPAVGMFGLLALSGLILSCLQGLSGITRNAATALVVIILFRVFGGVVVHWPPASQFTWVTLFALCAFLALGRARHSARNARLWILVSISGAGAATLTYGNGLVVWPVLVVGAWLLGLSWRTITILLVVGAAVTVTYLMDFRTIPGHSDPSLSMRSTRTLVDFVLHYFGSPLSRLEQPLAKNLGRTMGAVVCFGAAGFTVNSAACRLKGRREDGATAALIMLLLFAVGSAVTTGLIRIDLGVYAATANRYAIVQESALAALVVLSTRRFGTMIERFPTVLAAAIVSVAALILVEDVWVGGHALERASTLRMVAASVKSGATDLSKLASVHPNPKIAAGIIDMARQAGIYGLRPFPQ